jgi:hypothetical protein
MEVYVGSQTDPSTSWTFSFNGGEDMAISEENLDGLCSLPDFFIRYTSV